MSEPSAAAIIEQLIQMNALESMNADPEFALSAQQLALHDRRSKTPIDKCIAAEVSISQLKKKYDL